MVYISKTNAVATQSISSDRNIIHSNIYIKHTIIYLYIHQSQCVFFASLVRSCSGEYIEQEEERLEEITASSQRSLQPTLPTQLKAENRPPNIGTILNI